MDIREKEWRSQNQIEEEVDIDQIVHKRANFIING